MSYALILDGIVIDIAAATYVTSLPAASWMDASPYAGAAIGWRQVGSTLQPPEAAQAPRRLAKLVIIDRATDAEIATLAAMRTSPDATLRRFAARWDAAQSVNVDNAENVAAFAAVFGAARAAELLA